MHTAFSAPSSAPTAHLPPVSAPTQERFLRLPEVIHQCGLSRSSRYLSDSVKHRYYQCQNVLCSATFRSMESVESIIRLPVASDEPDDDFIQAEMDKEPKQRPSATQ